MASVNSAIKIYCRVKPFPDPLVPYDILSADKEQEMLQLTTKEEHPPTSMQAYLNNKPEQYKFRFSKVFDRTSRQDYIFQEVARPVIDSALQGYNGTIFAYGQTGTGKTYTMTGSRSSFKERGIIPRTLEYIFQKFDEDKNPSKVRNVFVSYLEIYNEAGYDLLNPSTMTGRMDDLGRVSLMEDGSQQMHLRNLSVHSIESVEEATQFLYLGDHNRTIAETPLNEVSTRSHCIFTIHLNMRDVNTSLTTRSKLHLVDLAGSERVSTTSTTSQLATEARHINLALHYLEQVIVALGDSNRSHIPYRNSMMTSVLRDSLGGNCMTSMIATISLDPRNTQETLSTCRFSQRVAMVTNAVQRNEDLDPNIIITQLKSEVKKLREIIECNSIKPLKESAEPLTDDELSACSFGVQQFLADNDPKAALRVVADMRMVQECFRILKAQITFNGPLTIEPFKMQSNSPTGNSAVVGTTNEGNGESSTFVLNERNFPQLLARRDAEIRVLTDMIRREKTKRSQTPTPMTAKPSLEDLSGSVKTGPFSTTRESSPGATTQIEFMHPYQPGRTEDDQVRHSSDQRCQDRNSSEDLPGVVSETSHRTASRCETPPPSRDDLGFDEISMTRHFTDSKRIALVTFINKYEGTPKLESLRAKLFERRSEIRALETTIVNAQQNIESLKKIAETAEQSHTSMDLCNLSVSLNDQQKTLDQSLDRLKVAREDVEETVHVVKTEYKKLMACFESWWKVTASMREEERRRDEQREEAGSVFKRSGVEERRIDGGDEVPLNFIEQGFHDGGDNGQPRPLNILKPNSKFTDEFKHHEKTPMECLPPRYPRRPPVTPASTVNSDMYETVESDSGDDEQSQDGSNELEGNGDAETDQEVLQFLQARKQVFQVMKQKKEQGEAI